MSEPLIEMPSTWRLQIDAAIARAERAEAQCAALREALEACMSQWRAPDEGHSAYFERQAERFYRETGYLAPGKSEPLEMRNVVNDEVRQRLWREFFSRPWQISQAALSADAGSALLAELKALREVAHAAKQWRAGWLMAHVRDDESLADRDDHKLVTAIDALARLEMEAERG